MFADIISLPRDMRGLASLRKELSQPTRAVNGALKLVVDKKPEGTRSPNKADALVMAFWPAEDAVASVGFLDLVRAANAVTASGSDQGSG